jgi:hypothetical protein
LKFDKIPFQSATVTKTISLRFLRKVPDRSEGGMKDADFGYKEEGNEVRISSLSSSKHLMMLIWHPLASSF